MATALFSAMEVIDESLPGFTAESLNEVINAARHQLCSLAQEKKSKAVTLKSKAVTLLPPPICVTANVMIQTLVPALDESSLRHLIAVARRLSKVVPGKALRWRQQQVDQTGDVDVFQLLAGMASVPPMADCTWDVWNLLECMAKEGTSQGQVAEELDFDVWQLLQGMVKTRTWMIAESDVDVWQLLEGMAEQPQLVDRLDWWIFKMLAGMAKEPAPAKKPTPSALAKKPTPSAHKLEVQEMETSDASQCADRPSTANLPCADEKTSLRHALRHSRLQSRRFFAEKAPAVLLTAPLAFAGYSHEDLVANITEMQKSFPLAPAPAAMAFPKLPPAPKLAPRLTYSPKAQTLRQPGGRYGHVQRAACAH